MQLKTSKTFILFVLVSSISCEPEYEWREVSVKLKRAIGSAGAAADHRGVTYISMLKAYERIDTVPYSYYWVSFIARSREEEVVRCEAQVEWTFPLQRIVHYAKCKPVKQQRY